MRSRSPAVCVQAAPPAGPTNRSEDSSFASVLRWVRPSGWCRLHSHCPADIDGLAPMRLVVVALIGRWMATTPGLIVCRALRTAWLCSGLGSGGCFEGEHVAEGLELAQVATHLAVEVDS